MIDVTPREMSSRDVYKSVGEKRKSVNERLELRKNRTLVLAATVEDILRAGPEADSWNTKTSNVSGLRREIQAVKLVEDDRVLSIHLIELHRKFAVPFGAFFFVFLAVSLGLMAKKSGQTVGFIFGIIISVIYWSLLFIGQTMSSRVGTPPFWSMWFPNILCLVIGLLMALKRIVK